MQSPIPPISSCRKCAKEDSIQFFLLSRAQTRANPKKQNTYVEDNSLVSMVARGFGVSLLPRLVLVNCHEKVRLAPLDRACYRNVGILCDEERGDSPTVKKFIHFIKNWDYTPYQKSFIIK